MAERGNFKMEGKQHDPLHSIASGAKFLGGISQWTLYAWLSQGKLPRVKVGRRTMVRESELVKLIHEKEPQPRRSRRQA